MHTAVNWYGLIDSKNIDKADEKKHPDRLSFPQNNIAMLLIYHKH